MGVRSSMRAECERLARELAEARREIAALELDKRTLTAELAQACARREVLESLVYGLEKKDEKARREIEALRMASMLLKTEQDDLLANVRQGILTFGQDLRIHAGFSRTAGEMFGRTELAGLTLPVLLGERAPAELPRFLKLLFDATAASGRLLERVNPVRAHRFHDATGRERVVAFSFTRIVRRSGDIGKVMAVMEDCTEVHRLNQALIDKRREDLCRFERASQILALPPDVFRDFVLEARAVAQDLERDLERPDEAEFESRLRSLHAVKGNARALGLDELAHQAHAIEEATFALGQRKSEARLSLLRDHLASFTRLLSDGDELFVRMTGLRKSFDAVREDPVDALFRSLETLVEREGSLDKLIAITCSREGLTEVPSAAALYRLRSALVQLVRNAVHHGIEDKRERAARGKPELGTIRIELSNDGANVSAVCEDDGRGVNRRGLMEKAVAQGLLDPSERLDARASLRLMFQPGLTTSRVTSLGAGRGMGMSVVADAILCVGGDLDVESEPQKGTVFRLRVPAQIHESDSERVEGGVHEHLGG